MNNALIESLLKCKLYIILLHKIHVSISLQQYLLCGFVCRNMTSCMFMDVPWLESQIQSSKGELEMKMQMLLEILIIRLVNEFKTIFNRVRQRADINIRVES